MRVLMLLSLFSILMGREVRAFTFATPGPLSNPLGDLSGITDVFIRTLGIVLNHRSYEPATPLGTSPGIDLGVDVTLVQLPSTLLQGIPQAGTVTLPPIFPEARMLNLHKGLTDSIDIGASYFSYLGITLWGADLKVVLANPEEGLTWAIRLGYASAYLPLGATQQDLNYDGYSLPLSLSMNLKTTTWTPQLLISRKLDFADPYMGVGYAFVTGSINFDVNTSLSIPKGITLPQIPSASASGGAFFAFLGLSLRMPILGLRMTLEGAYSPLGYNALGTKVGFGF